MKCCIGNENELMNTHLNAGIAICFYNVYLKKTF